MATIRLIPSTYYLSSSSYLSVTNPSNLYANTDSTDYARVYNSRNSTTSYYIYLRGFNFDDVPEQATVTSFTIKLKAYQTGISTSSSYKPYLANGTSTINGSCSAITNSTQVLTFTGLSADWETIKGYGSSFGIRINCRRASRNTAGYMYIYGAEILVEYTLPITHSITVTNDTSRTVTPTGSQSVFEGDSFSLSVSDTSSEPVITDNGVTVTPTQKTPSAPGYSVAKASGASYGFELNDDGYYESTNAGHNSSAAVCVVSIHTPVESTVTFTVINYAEDGYDFGLLSDVDGTLSTSASADSDYYWSGKNYNDSYPQTVTYNNFPAGEHEVYAKFFKDQYEAGGNDSFQFKVTISPNSSYSQDPYWDYTITNVTGDHVIVVSEPVVAVPPVITIQTPTRLVISSVSGYSYCTCGFTADQDLSKWEARATLGGVTPARGVGLLVESGTTLTQGDGGLVTVDASELTNGDGTYTITIYGRNTYGYWSDGSYDGG